MVLVPTWGFCALSVFSVIFVPSRRALSDAPVAGVVPGISTNASIYVAKALLNLFNRTIVVFTRFSQSIKNSLTAIRKENAKHDYGNNSVGSHQPT
jgi:hypothetical protein